MAAWAERAPRRRRARLHRLRHRLPRRARASSPAATGTRPSGRSGAVNKGSTGEGHKNEAGVAGAVRGAGRERAAVRRDGRRARAGPRLLQRRPGRVAARRAGSAARGATRPCACWTRDRSGPGASAPPDRPARAGRDPRPTASTASASCPTPTTIRCPKRIKLPAEMQALDLPDLVHVHGHRWLHLPGLLDGGATRRSTPRRTPTAGSTRGCPLEPTIEGPFRFPKPEA